VEQEAQEVQEDKVIQDLVEMEEMAFMDVAVVEQVRVHQLQELKAEQVVMD
jgi:hypothetical protein